MQPSSRDVAGRRSSGGASVPGSFLTVVGSCATPCPHQTRRDCLTAEMDVVPLPGRGSTSGCSERGLMGSPPGASGPLPPPPAAARWCRTARAGSGALLSGWDRVIVELDFPACGTGWRALGRLLEVCVAPRRKRTTLISAHLPRARLPARAGRLIGICAVFPTPPVAGRLNRRGLCID